VYVYSLDVDLQRSHLRGPLGNISGRERKLEAGGVGVKCDGLRDRCLARGKYYELLPGVSTDITKSGKKK
jgi:hypothetical protein